MITRIPLALAILLLAPLAAQAATARTTNRFELPLAFSDAQQWYEANQSGVMKASNCRIVEKQENGDLLVETLTRLGTCRYVLRRSREERTTQDGRAQTVYVLEYVRNVSGRITAQKCVTTYTDAGERTEVHVELTATVSGRLIPAFAVRSDLSNSLAGAERYIVSNARQLEADPTAE
ncbi:MAG: hypothetical protein RIC55_03895 [Pirellulaceae bacterium]